MAQQTFPPGPPVVGAVLLIGRDDEQASAPPATRPASPEAVGFHRVLKAGQGNCTASPAPTLAADGTACGPDGLLYTLGKAELDGGHVTEVKAERGSNAPNWHVNLSLDSDGATAFGKLSTELAGKNPPQNQLAIVVRGRLVSAPTVQSPITGGRVQISGNFDQKSVEKLAADITG